MEHKQYCEHGDGYQYNKVVISAVFTQEVQNSIARIAKSEGYVSYDMQTWKISTGGNNFLGELYEINIIGKTTEGDNETNLFLKHIIYNEDFHVYSIPEVYAKEAFVYNELRHIFDELQDSAHVPLEERLKLVKSFKETNKDVIILDNLAKRGFKTMPRLDVMSIEFAELSIKQLAKFHGLSFAIEKWKPEYYESQMKTIKQSFVYDDYWNDIVRKMCDISISRLDNETKTKIEKFFLMSLDKYPKYMNGLNSKFNCLCHGDYKMNNILMKENNGRVTEVIPVDYQQIYYGCPVIDVINFIYAASDRDFRKQHLNHLKDLYFKTLTSFLNYFDIEVASVFPRGEFEKCFRESLDYALIYAIYMLPMLFVDDNVPDLAKDELLEMSIQVNEKFFERMQGIVDDFLEWGII